MWVTGGSEWTLRSLGGEVTEEELVSGTNEDVELQGLPATASWLLQRLPYQPQAAFASGG